MKRSFCSIVILLIIFGLSTQFAETEAQPCYPSGKVRGVKPLTPECTTEGVAACCIEGKTYSIYNCSPPVSLHTKAALTLNSFARGDGGQPSICDNKYHSNDIPVVALSTGWFNNHSRCNRNITITGNGRSAVAMVVDECDSFMGCDSAHEYHPPCRNNIVDASQAVWKALGVPLSQWGELEVVWSDA